MENIAYLEVDDFNSDGSIKSYVNNRKPIVLMAQAHYCGYCKQAGPALEQFAKESPDLLVATIVTDGETSEQQAAKFIKKWDPNHRGVPAYFGFSPDGKFAKLHTGGRDVASLKKFSE
jgi:thiol-disulfide isomerase/thioredoxin